MQMNLNREMKNISLIFILVSFFVVNSGVIDIFMAVYGVCFTKILSL